MARKMSPSSIPSVSTPPIATEINHATKDQHDLLNRLITERVPRALPPHAKSLEIYGRGLAVFARLYYAFESAAYELSMLEEGSVTSQGAEITEEILVILDKLYVEGLPRSSRMHDDLAHVCKVIGIDVKQTLPDEQEEMAKRIRRDLLTKPHLLVAYTWVMYMAIFSGGRWVRRWLLDAGEAFWTGQQYLSDHEKADDTLSKLTGFTFLSFDGSQDGDDIKNEFKALVGAIEHLLTQEDRREIVEASQVIFSDCITLVGMLDGAVGPQSITWRKSRGPWPYIAGMILLLGYWWYWWYWTTSHEQYVYAVGPRVVYELLEQPD